MDREGDSPTPAEDTPAEGHESSTDPVGQSGSRWEPRDDPGAAPDEGTDPAAAEPDEQATTATAATPVPPAGTTWWHASPTTSAAAPRRRRGLRVAAGVGAAVFLAGGGFAAGHAVGDSGPDGRPDGRPGLTRHHHGDGEGDGPNVGGPGQTGQNQPGQPPAIGNTSGPSSPILGGLFT